MAGGEMSEGIPDYRVRRSARARYARLRLSPHDGLTVVVPLHFDVAEVPRLIEQQRAWLDRASARLGGLPTPEVSAPPSVVELLATGEVLDVAYEDGRGSAMRSSAIERAGGHLVVRGTGGDAEVARAALRRWLDRRARATLEPWLLELAGRVGVDVARVAIRAQRTRWGSCSADGTISLNRSLVFLPPALVSHVLLHELCHRRHLDHSPSFWRLLSDEDPGTREHRQALGAAWRHVPAWVRT